ncbi:o-succinylbenzoate synthase [Aestuariimicrobium ganziense]|uniref:o-succinylbenzoate synthase n=1 Tax=Aestuariimicrobium ganziense TaxID=2773677 RepID=UPI0019407781|nr:o-succinylbenzoate synthase [Aestuariimicrobium ganziense]
MTRPTAAAVGVHSCHQIAMTTRFRGITVREGLLVQGEAGVAEWSPFWDYGQEESATWWRAAVEAATLGYPTPVRDEVPVNVTVPALDPETAHALTRGSRCRTAKVKVAEPGQSLTDDLARVEAVRDALGADGRVRVDANGAWSVEDAVTALRELNRFDLEYAEQPCADVEHLADLRRRLVRAGIDVPIAADESIRRSGDPERVVALDAADIAVLKVQPLGGVRACLELAERLGLPVVVSSALETSVGLRMGVALAAALPDLPYACGLNTAALLTDDVATPATQVTALDGSIRVSDLVLDEAAVTRLAAPPEVMGRWVARLGEVLALEGAR